MASVVLVPPSGAGSRSIVVDERLERERLGQVAGDAELAQPARADGRRLATTTGGRAGRGERVAAEERPSRSRRAG